MNKIFVVFSKTNNFNLNLEGNEITCCKMNGIKLQIYQKLQKIFVTGTSRLVSYDNTGNEYEMVGSTTSNEVRNELIKNNCCMIKSK